MRRGELFTLHPSLCLTRCQVTRDHSPQWASLREGRVVFNIKIQEMSRMICSYPTYHFKRISLSQLTRDLLGVPYSSEVQPASKCQFILTESPSSGRETLSFTGTLLCVRPPSALLLCPCLQLLYRDV